MSAGAEKQAAEHVQRISAEVDKALRTFVDKQPLGQFYELMRYELGWQEAGAAPPPRPRSVLCVLACEACGGSLTKALPAAMSVALLHDFAVIQEDMEWHREMHRGRPAVWRLWGTPQAMNAGDGMHALAKMALLECRGEVPGAAILHLEEELDEACLRVCEALHEELTRPDGSALDMAARKEAALFGCAAYVGSYLGGGDEAARSAMRRFGELVGSATGVRRLSQERSQRLRDEALQGLDAIALGSGARSALRIFCESFLGG